METAIACKVRGAPVAVLATTTATAARIAKGMQRVSEGNMRVQHFE